MAPFGGLCTLSAFTGLHIIMTDKTQTIEDLRKEVEEMKAARVEELNAQAEERKQNDEIADLKRQLDNMKAGGMPNSSPQAVMMPTERDVKSAAVRQVMCGFSHAFFGPVASVYYSAKVGNWIPTAAATGIAFLSLPVALFDLGITFALAPPITSALLVISDSQEKRRKLGITMPEQADAMMAKYRTF